uniref:Uncharacterized protein n=1 Tax=Anguilla anguilla TaxID=7936 RepID=A0A0E9UD91_ANGAN
MLDWLALQNPGPPISTKTKDVAAADEATGRGSDGDNGYVTMGTREGRKVVQAGQAPIIMAL